MINVHQISTSPERFRVVDEFEHRTLLDNAEAIEVFDYFERIAKIQAREGARSLMEAATARGVTDARDSAVSRLLMPASDRMN